MAILKIRDDKGVITNIAAIKGENGKSPIIKNDTWWTYDDELEKYVDTGLGAEKESVVTKSNVEKVLTGTIDSHNHDNIYVKEAPSDSKQYVRYNGEWNAIDLSSYSTTAENDAKYQVKGNYITSIPTASSGTLGGIKTGYSTSSSNKNYAVQLDSSSNAYVNVPWTDNNTTYSAGTGISLSGTTFSNSGVRSVTAGSSSNQLSVNTGGTTSTITINNVANATNATNSTNATNATTAASANKLSTARNISLSGSVTGSASFDGSSNITIDTTTNHTHNDAVSKVPSSITTVLMWASVGVLTDSFESKITAEVAEGETKYFISATADKLYAISVTSSSIKVIIQEQSSDSSRSKTFTYNRSDKTHTFANDGITFSLTGDGSKYLDSAGKYSDPCPHIKAMSDELSNAIDKVSSSVEATKTEAITYLSNNIAENTKTIYVKNEITSVGDMMFLTDYCLIVRFSKYDESNTKTIDTIYISFANLYSWINPDIYPVHRTTFSINLLDNTVFVLESILNFSSDGTVTYMGTDGETDYSYNLISSKNIFDVVFRQHNSVTTLASLPTDKYSIQAKVTAATTLSFSETPKNGMEYVIDILNNSSSDIIQSLPNTDPYQSNVDSITLPAGKVTSISVRYVFNKYIIKV